MVFLKLKQYVYPCISMILDPVLEPVLRLFSLTKKDLEHWYQSPILPVLHALLLIVFICILVKFLLNRKKKMPDIESRNWLIDPEAYRTTLNHLTWVNKIIMWLFMTSQEKMPESVEVWIQDLNEHLARQKNHFGTLIFGLREGSALPAMLEIKAMDEVKNEIHAEVLLKSTEFGFLVAVQEEDTGVAAKNYVAIVAQFECWFTATFTRIGGDVGLILKPNEKKPSFRFQMKPLTKHVLKSVLPESVGQALQRAVLHTPFIANLNSSIAKMRSKLDFSLLDDEAEKSCCSGTEAEDDYMTKHVKLASTREVRSSSFGSSFDKPPFGRRHHSICNSFSAPGSRSETPVGNGVMFQEAGDTPVQSKSGSLGSLNNITRTPSGRGPAKPIRIREKQLLVKVLSFDTYDTIPTIPTHCLVDLDFPHQRKCTEMPSEQTLGHRLTFDLSSRSSRLKVNLRNSPDSESSPLAIGAVQIESINMEKPTTVTVPMVNASESEIGYLCLVLFVLENGDKNPADALSREFRLPGEPYRKNLLREQIERHKAQREKHNGHAQRDSSYYEARDKNYHRESSKHDKEFRPERRDQRHRSPDKRQRNPLASKGARREHSKSPKRERYRRESPKRERYRRESPKRDLRGTQSPKRESRNRSEERKRENRDQSRERSGNRDEHSKRDHRRRSNERKSERRKRPDEKRRLRRKSDDLRYNVVPAVDAAPLVNRDYSVDDDASRTPTEPPSLGEASFTDDAGSPTSFLDAGETKITKVTKVKGSPSRNTLQASSIDPSDSTTSIDFNDQPAVSYNVSSVAEAALKDLSTQSVKNKSPAVTRAKISITTVEQTNGQPSLNKPHNFGNRFTNPTALTSDESDFDTLVMESSGGSEDSTKSAEEKPFFRTRSLVFDPQGEGKEDGSSKSDTHGGESNMNVLNRTRDALTPVKKKSSSMNKLFSRMSRSKKIKADKHIPIAEESYSEEHDDNYLRPSDSALSTTKVRRSRSFKEIIKGKKKPSKYK